MTAGTVPQIFGLPSAAHWSAHSPIGDDGRDRIDRDHFVELVRDIGGGLVAVDGYFRPVSR